MNTVKHTQSINDTRTVSLDIMKNKGRTFYKTLRYTFTPPICLDALLLWVVHQLPSLSGKKFMLYVNDIVDSEETTYKIDVSCKN